MNTAAGIIGISSGWQVAEIGTGYRMIAKVAHDKKRNRKVYLYMDIRKLQK